MRTDSLGAMAMAGWVGQYAPMIIEALKSAITEPVRRAQGGPNFRCNFVPWRLHFCSYALAVIYGALFIGLYKGGAWIVHSNGVPIYSDFITAWLAGGHALERDIGPIYDPAAFVKIQEALVGPRDYFYPNWPYPPTYFLFLTPFAALPYAPAFLAWSLVTLLGCIAVVFLIARRLSAIPLLLASPFGAWNLFAGQSGFLTASLLGAALLLLERQPVLAGGFIACLTFKPHLGLLIPIALIAWKEWRAIASAAGTILLLAGGSILAFGIGAWEAFPRELLAQTGEVLGAGGHAFADPYTGYGYIETVYGLVRRLHGTEAAAWLAQAAVSLTTATLVWFVWRAQTRYALKAATLSAALLLTTPYAFAYDFVTLAIPVAFLAADQLRYGVLPGEKSTLLALFGLSLIILLSLGSVPLGAVIIISLLLVIARRVFAVGATGLNAND